MLSSAQMHWPSNEGRPGSPGSDDATPEAVSLQLERLWDMVKRQQQSITDLHIDNEALRQTLGRKMLLETTEYEIIRHRVRFTWMQQVHPCEATATMNKVMEQDTSAARSMATGGTAPSTMASSPGTAPPSPPAPATLKIGIYLDTNSLCDLAAASPDCHWHVMLLSRVYLVGGVDVNWRQQQRSHDRSILRDINSAERLEIISGGWETVAPMPSPRTRMASAATMGRFYVIGGLQGDKASNYVDCLDMLTGQWSSDVPPLMHPRAACAAAAVRNKIYVLGGSSDGREFLRTVECLDLCQGKWSTQPPMGHVRSSLASASHDGYIYAIGGRDGRRPLKACECFNPATGIWNEIPAMRMARFDFPAVTAFDRILAIGGFSERQRVLGSVEAFNPRLHHWETLMPLPHPAASCAAAVTHGRVLVFGGINGTRTLPCALCMMLKDGAWRNLQLMQTSRMAAVAASPFVVEGARVAYR